eukprot:214713_1
MLLLSLDDYSPRKLMLRGDFPQARAFPFNSANKLQKAPKRKYTQKLIVLKVNIGMFLRNKMATKPRRGVFQLRAPSEIIKRTVRGMITSRTKREWSTLKNMKQSHLLHAVQLTQPGRAPTRAGQVRLLRPAERRGEDWWKYVGFYVAFNKWTHLR